MPSGNGKPRFSVRLSDEVVADLKQLQRQASREGRRGPFLTAYRTIAERLIHAPRDFGEPLYRLPALRLEVRHGIVRPLMIYFAVHDEEPLVFVKGVSLLPA